MALIFPYIHDKNAEHYDIILVTNTASLKSLVSSLKGTLKRYTKFNQGGLIKNTLINATNQALYSFCIVIVNGTKVHPGKMSGHNFRILVSYFSSITVIQF